MLEVHLLGKLEVKYNKKPITISSRPAQSLFAYLILNAGISHRREKLAGLLWPDSLEETARDNLRHALWRMRKALESASATRFLHADDVTISFKQSSDYWLDAAELEKLNKNASADELITVLSNYQGELLPGFYDEWVVLEREHLHSVFEHHMARLLSLLEKEKRWSDLLDWAERWIKLGQKPEPAYRALMTAHAAKGDMSKVASTFERCVKSLKEIGMEPSQQTRALYEQLKAGKVILETPPSVPMEEKRKGSPKINLPVPSTSFVGRKRELKEITGLFLATRLLTLIGTGGVGKTRLAIRTANELIGNFKDGVFWVGLVGLSDASLIPQEIAQSLQVREIPTVPLIETLKNELRDKKTLLVFDNCEHLIDAVAQIAEQLLSACPYLSILATSRERLRIFNETVWPVPSLSESTGRQLFAERARAAQHDFALNDSNESIVTQICERLDRIPLAIELAAARVALLSVEEIARRLDDRLSLLTSGSRTALARQQTLRAAIDWSHDLLTEPERILFRRLAVFAGGFSLEAVEAVCGFGGLKRSDVLDLLGRLVDKSLVVVEADSALGETRYHLLETIRQYAMEKLIESEEARSTRDEHLAFYLDLAEKSEPHTYDSESVPWHHRLASDFDNIRAALDWATGCGQANAVLRIMGSLAQYWFTHGRPVSEWYRRVEDALASPEGRVRSSARAKALNGMGLTYWGDMDPVDQRQRLEEALAIGQELDDKWNIATALRNLGLILVEHEGYEEARSCLVQSLEIWQEMGNEFEMGQVLTFLGAAAMDQGDDESAASFFERSVVILKSLGNLNVLALALRRLGQLAWRAGDFEKAIPLCRESLLLNRETDDPRGVLASIAGFADIAVAQGKFERAARLMAAVQTLLASLGLQLVHLDRLDYERNLALLKSKLDEKTLAKFWAKGKELSFDEAIAFALEEK